MNCCSKNSKNPTLHLVRLVLACLACAIHSAGGEPRPLTWLVVGDAAGNVCVRNLAGTPLCLPRATGSCISRIDIVDVNGDQRPEALATHDELNAHTQCLDLPMLLLRWTSSHPTCLLSPGNEQLGNCLYVGDFDQDGELELLSPQQENVSNGTLYQVLTAKSGIRECALPERVNYLGIPYIDPVDADWKLAAQYAPNGSTHHLRKYSLPNCGPLECTNGDVNMWKMGAIGKSMCDGKPRIWGGWYGRTLYVTDGNCNLLWVGSFGGGLEAEGFYAGDLRKDGVETILVGGTYNTQEVGLDAANLCNGALVWSFRDTGAHWYLSVMAAEDVDGDGIKEVFVYTRGSRDYGPKPKYQALSGLDGSRLWEVSYDYDTHMVSHTRVIDVDGDGRKEVLLIVNNSIEARDALTSTLVRTYLFDYEVNSFGLATIPTYVGDMNCDGVRNFADINPFVLAISDQGGYERQYPHCDVWLADCNEDGWINFADINRFVVLLGGN